MFYQKRKTAVTFIPKGVVETQLTYVELFSIGVSDKTWGERIVAAVKPEAGKNPEANELNLNLF